MEFSVGIDVGARTHHVAILDPDGRLNEAFEIPHQIILGLFPLWRSCPDIP